MSSVTIFASIDIGTTYSGYAFAYKAELETGQHNVYSNAMWNAGNFQSQKTPNCLLLNPRKKFDSFGYRAEEKYADLCEQNEYQDWFYFKRFKMNLSGDTKFNRDMIIDDEAGKSFPAIEVFSLSIRFLKEQLWNLIKSRGFKAEESDIRWILTVPAIWNQDAKQFMREAAVEAGINGKSLKLALEPEAASVWCITSGVYVNNPGSVYMLCDLGGGTVDITVHSIENDRKLSEVHKASGGPWGGVSVDLEFQKLFRELVGDEVVKRFSEPEMKPDYDRFMGSFELSKRSFDLERGKVEITVPSSLREICEANGKTLEEMISNSKYSTNIKAKRDKLTIDRAVLDELYQPAISPIIEHIENTLATGIAAGVSSLLFVGGFSDAVLVQHALKKKFDCERMEVIFPHDASMCVLKGAVIFGFSPNKIVARIMRFTFGIRRSEIFQEGKHNPEYRFKSEDTERCDNVFQILVKNDEKIKYDQIIEKRSKTLKAMQDSIPYQLYVSPGTPQYVTDETCRLVGEYRVEITPTKEIQWFNDKYVFGDTEISLEVKCEKTSKKWQFTFPLV